MNVIGVILCLMGLLLIDPSASEKFRFDDYKIYELRIETPAQLKALKGLPTGRYFYEFLDQPEVVGQQAEIVVPPQLHDEFVQLADSVKLAINLQVYNLQKLIDEEERVSTRAEGYGWDAFYRLEDIYNWMDSLTETHPGVVTKIVGGQTHDGRTINGVMLSRKHDSPTIFIESNIHAREWITSASTTWIINELLTSTDPEVKALLDNYNWIIFPVFNPDGFEYCHTDYRLWRKTRSRQGLICWGVDPNRNWAGSWQIGGPGSSDDVCSDTYGGAFAFSEIETKSMSEYIESIEPRPKIYLSFHSAAQMILSPWGHTDVEPDNHADLMAVSTAAYNRLHAVYGTNYTFGPTYTTIYPATGGSADWAYGELGIGLAYTYEFRGRHANGTSYSFVAPPSEIVPNAREVLQSLVGMMAKAAELNYFD